MLARRVIKRRLRQYFSSSVKEAKVTAMMRHASDVKYTITETEGDALLLEATQIKSLSHAIILFCEMINPILTFFCRMIRYFHV